jgi:hypothetical protein
MLMVILGAGASFDSAQAYRPVHPSRGGYQSFAPSSDVGGPWRPPLAKDLFLDRHHALGSIVTHYPKLSHILPYLREPSNGRSVEEILESLQEEGKDNPESQRELASVRYYLCELLHKVTEGWLEKTNRVTNYAPLLRDILRFKRSSEPVCLVTFNYDLLLENALVTFGFKLNTPELHLGSHPILKLFKLHGSTNWSRLVNGQHGNRLSPQHIIEQADTIEVSETFVLANATDVNEMYKFEDPVFPAIAIPVQTKSEAYFECPRAHLTYLVQMLDRVTKILIIGWQAREAHFLGMLKHKLPLLRQVMVVGANAANAEKTLLYFAGEIAKGMASENCFVGQGGFTDFIVSQEGQDFFKA